MPICRSHLYRKHKEVPEVEQGSSRYQYDTDVPVGTSTDDIECTMCEPAVDDRTEEERQRKAALFILKAREERMLTQSALNGLLEDITCKDLFQLTWNVQKVHMKF